MYGPDKKFLKMFNECLSDLITDAINRSINEGVFPRAWKTAIITAICKTGGPAEVCNYRPISRVPVLSKVIIRYVAEQLTGHLYSRLHPMHLVLDLTSQQKLLPAFCWRI